MITQYEIKSETPVAEIPLHTSISRAVGWLVVMAIALLVRGPVLFAEDDLKPAIAKISSIQNSIERLAAFDALSAKLGLAPGGQEKAEQSSGWQISIETSPVDDSQTVTAILPADAPVGTGFGLAIPRLILRYKEGVASAYVGYSNYLGSDHTDATVRFGKAPAENQSWDISTNGKSAFSPGDADAFMQRLATVDTFLIRVTPFGENPITASFPTKGVDKAIEAIRRAAKLAVPQKAAQNESQTSEGKKAHAEQVPLSGFEKTENGTSTGNASDAKNPDGGLVAVQQTSKAQPIARSRLTAARSTILTNRATGTTNIGILGQDARWSEYSEYLQEVLEIIQVQWYKLLAESRVSPPRRSHVDITFKINSKGETEIVKVEDADAGKQGVFSCQNAITIPQPYRKWTDQMIAVLGDEQQLTLSFYYQ